MIDPKRLENALAAWNAVVPRGGSFELNYAMAAWLESDDRYRREHPPTMTNAQYTRLVNLIHSEHAGTALDIFAYCASIILTADSCQEKPMNDGLTRAQVDEFIKANQYMSKPSPDEDGEREPELPKCVTIDEDGDYAFEGGGYIPSHTPASIIHTLANFMEHRELKAKHAVPEVTDEMALAFENAFSPDSPFTPAGFAKVKAGLAAALRAQGSAGEREKETT